MSALQLGFTDDIDPGLSLKLISQSMLAFFNRHLPLTEAQRSQLQQSQAVSDFTHMPGASSDSTRMPGASARGDKDLATTSQHRSSAEDQASYKGQDTTIHIDQSAAAQESGLRPGQIVLDGLSDGLSGGTALNGRTYASRVTPEERELFEDICRENIAILDLSL